MRGIGAIAIAGAALLGSAAPAAAHHPDSGLQVVRPKVGPPLLTHGPDPRPPLAARRAAARPEFGDGVAGRPPACTDTAHLRFLYARPAGAPNQLGQAAATIRESIYRTNAVLNAESLASGGPTADYRVDCDPDGQITVGSFVSSGSSFGQVVAAARAAGFDSDTADYMIFFDGTSGSACGTASIYDDDRLSSANDANQGGGYGIAYGGCWTEETPMHEISHMMGAVQYSAPHSTGTGGHCYEENDVLCYSPDGGDLNQDGTVTHCTGAVRFDCNFDDYFDSAPEPGEYLASHWNLGSPLNAFIAFGGGAQGGGFIDSVLGLVDELLAAGRTNGAGAGVAGAPGEWKLHRIEVTGSTKLLTVRLTGVARPGLKLYVRSRRAPSADEYACRAVVKVSSATCRIRRPRNGPWIAGVVNGDAAASGEPYTVRARLKR